MTVTDLAARRVMTATEKRDAARRDLADDPNLNGAEVGRRYEMSEAWGRKQQRHVRDVTGSTPATRPVTDQHETVTPTVTAPVPRHEPELAADEPGVDAKVDATHAASRVEHTVTVVAVVVVAAVAAAISYAHMRHLAQLAGEGWRADLLPLSVDGMMVAASMTALAKRRRGQRAWIAWIALGLGVVASLVANIAAADPTIVDLKVVQRIVAAWPPLALVLAFELLLEQGRDR